MTALCCMVAVGWKIGTNQSLCLICAAGMAVDYILHMGHSYNHQKGNRQERVSGLLVCKATLATAVQGCLFSVRVVWQVRATFAEMGISVTYGASVGAFCLPLRARCWPQNE